MAAKGEAVGEEWIGNGGLTGLGWTNLYIGWINNKVLLYSIGSYIQYPVINHDGKEYDKEYMYV